MPDARRPSRRPTAPTPTRASRPAPPDNATPSIVGALLRGQPELTLLQKAAAGLAKIALVDDRLALVSTIVTIRPGALVLPPYDNDRTSTAPLVVRVRREVPSVAVVIISCHPGGAGQPFLRAVQAGAHVIAAPTLAELRTALAALLHGPGLTGPLPR